MKLGGLGMVVRWYQIFSGALAVTILCSGCAIIRFAGDTVVFAGKVTTTLVKTTAAVVVTTAKVTVGTVRYFTGERKVKLRRDGDSYYVSARINGKRKVELLVDTGATSVQLSEKQAKTIGIPLDQAEVVRCELADGSIIEAKSVMLDEVKVGSVEAEDVHAVILPTDSDEGLLGMSFLGGFEFSIDTEKELLILRYREKK
jgi:clan AA aspartic protease (TIGR02281 family)